MPRFEPKQQVKFTYSDHGTPVSFPQHIAHSGQTVTVTALVDEIESVEPMYRVTADDGWTAEVFEGELSPTEAQSS